MTPSPTLPESDAPGGVLILGDASLGEALALRFGESEVRGVAIPDARDSELADALRRPVWRAVAVVTHDDAFALRLTLLSCRVRPDLPVWVTLFDRTLAHRFQELAPEVHIVAASELVAHELAQLCMASVPAPAGGRRRFSGVRVVDDALRLMLAAGGGLLAALVVQTVLTAIALHDGISDAIYFSTRSIATVADAPRAQNAASWFKLGSTLVTIVSVVLLAVFTAALVRRLSGPRLTTLFGRRRPVAGGHALLVGFGQIGFRLAQELLAHGVPVLAIEQDEHAPCVRLARQAGIPVLIGRGDDREVLELAGMSACAVVAAVTSDDLVNVAVGLAATDLRPGAPLVLRLGDGNVAAETDSLLHLGRICDAHALVAGIIAESILG